MNTIEKLRAIKNQLETEYMVYGNSDNQDPGVLNNLEIAINNIHNAIIILAIK